MFSTAFIQKLDDIRNTRIDLNGDGSFDCAAERFTTYGVLSKPLPNTKAITLRKNQKFVIICEQNSFPNIEKQILDGDVALTDGTQKIQIKKSGEIEIAGGKITISAGDVTIGKGAAQGLITQSFLPFYISHTHGSPAGATTPPVIPVQMTSVTTKNLKAV